MSKRLIDNRHGNRDMFMVQATAYFASSSVTNVLLKLTPGQSCKRAPTGRSVGRRRPS